MKSATYVSRPRKQGKLLNNDRDTSPQGRFSERAGPCRASSDFGPMLRDVPDLMPALESGRFGVPLSTEIGAMMWMIEERERSSMPERIVPGKNVGDECVLRPPSLSSIQSDQTRPSNVQRDTDSDVA